MAMPEDFRTVLEIGAEFGFEKSDESGVPEADGGCGRHNSSHYVRVLWLVGRHHLDKCGLSSESVWGLIEEGARCSRSCSFRDCQV